MTQAARITPDDRILEVGTGSGYQAAVLAHLARFVCSVERIAALAREAKARIDSLGLENVSIKVMDGSLGWRAQAPYGAILVTAGAPEVPEPLVEQLADGGRLVVPVGPAQSQVLKVVERRGPTRSVRELRGACFVPLIGRHGWDDGAT
jgi:protein-L-isoaspartate(D-aspartate) O-methyltransferase